MTERCQACGQYRCPECGLAATDPEEAAKELRRKEEKWRQSVFLMKEGEQTQRIQMWLFLGVFAFCFVVAGILSTLEHLGIIK